jgi:hypothetical protein
MNWRLRIGLVRLHLLRDRRGLLQGGLQVVGDFLGEDVGRRQVVAVFQALVAEPEDVVVVLVPLHKVVVVERPPIAAAWPGSGSPVGPS